MQILTQPLPITELAKIAKQTFYDLVKAVVDIEKELVAIQIKNFQINNSIFH